MFSICLFVCDLAFRVNLASLNDPLRESVGGLGPSQQVVITSQLANANNKMSDVRGKRLGGCLSSRPTNPKAFLNKMCGRRQIKGDFLRPKVCSVNDPGLHANPSNPCNLDPPVALWLFAARRGTNSPV